jgi:Ribonuclease G/E
MSDSIEIPADLLERAHALLRDHASCPGCRGTGVIRRFDGGMNYETDSPAEVADHYYNVRCPDCLKRTAEALLEARREAKDEKIARLQHSLAVADAEIAELKRQNENLQARLKEWLAAFETLSRRRHA